MSFDPAFDARRFAGAAGRVVLLLCVALAGSATAQESESERAPLEMTFVDATPQNSGAIHDKLRQIISNSDDINFADPDEFLFSAKDFKITIDVLGSKEKREEHTELLRRAMRANELEAVVVYKRTGDSLHLIVMGPNGDELEHYEAPVKRSQITDEQAVKVLEKLFEVHVPEVRAFRKKKEKAAERTRKADRESEDLQADDADEEVDEGGEGESDASGPVATHVTISGSPVVGRRSLTMHAPDRDAILTHITPFVGGELRLNSNFGVLSLAGSALGGTLYAQYGRFTTQFRRVERTVAGTVFRAGGAFRYLAGLSDRAAIFGELGGQAFDVGLESNRIYVGSSYFSVLGGPGFVYRIADVGELRIAANVLGTLVTSTNEQAFGAGNVSIGASGEAQFTLRILDPLLFSAHYDVDLYRPTHENPAEYEGPVSGSDLIHLGGLSVGYRF